MERASGEAHATLRGPLTHAAQQWQRLQLRARAPRGHQPHNRRRQRRPRLEGEHGSRPRAPLRLHQRKVLLSRPVGKVVQRHPVRRPPQRPRLGRRAAVGGGPGSGGGSQVRLAARVPAPDEGGALRKDGGPGGVLGLAARVAPPVPAPQGRCGGWQHSSSQPAQAAAERGRQPAASRETTAPTSRLVHAVDISRCATHRATKASYGPWPQCTAGMCSAKERRSAPGV